MTVTNADKNTDALCLKGIGGSYSVWYKNGQKKMEGNINNDKKVGLWREWDEKGNLIEEIDYGTPND